MKAEKPFHPISGYTILTVLLLVTGLAGALGYYIGPEVIAPFSLVFIFLSKGFKIVNPNESRVLTLFGEYAGTIKQNGFFWVNPFLVSKNISLRARNLDTTPIKVNDKLGNPIMIGVVLVWRVEETFKAAFEVDNYETFVKIQSESAMRKLAGVYPYDNFENDAEISLRASSQEVNDELERELMERLAIAGIHVLEARISYLAYAQEIASAMLQRQQATAIVAARAKIVEGAVGMVDMALHQLNDKRLVALDEERKAAMVTNLMVVLCSDRSVHPVVNAGTLHH
ncbi:SPFH domain-containing protein [Rufibacter sediminis]|uniref:SPFH domain-containing protein n=1 Tax=Rufibacter sediminis TaxID=2762756 RepID=A0ABR6VMX7_9BACT|nr:SPFH domain-containing protein [Rufibacter sediminis]MBC3538546.1 SPFH domain-containing protein [Rufibacter sediminis]